MIPSSLKVLNALSVLATAREPIGLSEVAERLEVPRPTAHRLLTALVDGGWANSVGKPRRYVASLRAVELGFAAARGNRTRSVLLEVLRDTAHRVSPYTLLLIFYEDANVYITDAVEMRSERVVSRVLGTRIPAAIASSGRIYLAFQPEDEVERALRHPLVQRTKHTITDRAAILREIELARERGYAAVDRELDPTSSGMAVPVISDGVVVAMIGLSAIAGSITDETIARVLPPLLDAAAAGASALGNQFFS